MSSPSFLIVRLSAIGDCVMAAYSATSIRMKFPDAKIFWAVESRCSAVVAAPQLVTEKVEFPRDKWKKNRFRPLYWREQLALYRRLRREKFDYGVDLQGHSKTAIAIAMAKPKHRIAAAATDVFARRVLPVAPDSDPDIHTVERYLEVIRTINDEFELPNRPIMPEYNAILPGLGLPAGFVAIASSAGQEDKAYPVERWDQVATYLVDHGHEVLFVGGPGDPKPAARGVIDRVGQWSLEQTVCALSASRLILCGDTGAGHIGAAYGRPVISIFGPTDPARFRPYSSTAHIIQNGGATENTQASQVIAKAMEVLEDSPVSN